MAKVQPKTTTKDITSGPIAKEILAFALPLMVGNIFQMLYNTVDSIVVGNFVSIQALAAVGATSMITNMAVFFFNGFATGAGVVISHYFGAKNLSSLHRAVETTMAATFLFCILFTILGVAGSGFMLRFMATPDDVFSEAKEYLSIYFAGITGLLIYNMGSGILRAVGDTTRPLYFLIVTSVLNIFLDLLFVLTFHLGIAGVETVEALKEKNKADILAAKVNDAERAYFSAILDQIVAGAKIEIADEIVAGEAKEQEENMKKRIESQGLTFEQYLEITGEKIEDFRKKLADDCRKNLTEFFVLQTIGRNEKLTATDEDVDAEIAKMAENYKMKPEEIKKAIEPQLDQLKSNITNRKIQEFILANNK